MMGSQLNRRRGAGTFLLGLCGLFIPLVSMFLAVDLSAAEASTNKVKVLLVTGDDYPGHHWRQTTPLLADALRTDPRLDIVVAEDPNLLDSAALNSYAAVVLHFQNWEKPGPGSRARENLEQFVKGGKGLVLVHFACGAWYGEWPEFEKLAGRVWFGPTPPPGKRQHDRYGAFVVTPNETNPISAGLKPFETTDELYTCLIGDEKIDLVATATSKVDQKEYPIAFTCHPGHGRTFHCVLGHDVKALSVPGTQELFRRGCAWAAGLTPGSTSP